MICQVFVKSRGSEVYFVWVCIESFSLELSLHRKYIHRLTCKSGDRSVTLCIWSFILLKDHPQSNTTLKYPGSSFCGFHSRLWQNDTRYAIMEEVTWRFALWWWLLEGYVQIVLPQRFLAEADLFPGCFYYIGQSTNARTIIYKCCFLTLVYKLEGVPAPPHCRSWSTLIQSAHCNLNDNFFLILIGASFRTLKQNNL